MKRSTKVILLSASSVLLALLFLPFCKYFTCLDCGHTIESHTLMMVRESFTAPFYTFKSDTGRFPTTEEGIDALVRNPGLDGWRGPYIREREDAFDPWGRSLQYRCPGIYNIKTYDLYSLGPDGIVSDDDFTNWTKK